MCWLHQSELWTRLNIHGVVVAVDDNLCQWSGQSHSWRNHRELSWSNADLQPTPQWQCIHCKNVGVLPGECWEGHIESAQVGRDVESLLAHIFGKRIWKWACPNLDTRRQKVTRKRALVSNHEIICPYQLCFNPPPDCFCCCHHHHHHHHHHRDYFPGW